MGCHIFMAQLMDNESRLEKIEVEREIFFKS